jgi:hypothetical protein
MLSCDQYRSVGYSDRLKEFVIDYHRLRLVDSVFLRAAENMSMDPSRTGPQLTIFQPGLVLLCSLAGAALVGLYLCRYEHVRASVLDPAGTFQYFVPLMVPCFAFMLERIQHVRQANFFQHGVDFLVFGLAVGRVTGADVRYISGHTLLLSYMLVSSRSWIVRIAAILVLGQTLFLKYYVWGDFVTSNVGLMLGSVLALLVWWVSARQVIAGSKMPNLKY